MPSQSLSLPSQTSGAYVHTQTSLVWPASGPQDQPGTQLEAVSQVVVQTLVPFPIGKQTPLGQSPFLVQVCPVSPTRICVHVPAAQARFDEHALPAQHGSFTPPQAGPPES